MNIDEMPASRDMDILIAQALGHEVLTRREAIDLTNAAFPNRLPWDSWYVSGFYLKEDPIPSTGLDFLPNYSMVDADAISALEQSGRRWEISKYPGEPPYKVCVATGGRDGWACASGDRLALTICHALLKAAPLDVKEQPTLKGATDEC